MDGQNPDASWRSSQGLAADGTDWYGKDGRQQATGHQSKHVVQAVTGRTTGTAGNSGGFSLRNLNQF